jgi:hypothetical protein
VPIVMMSEGIRVRLTSSPLKQPTANPTQRAQAIPRPMGKP